MEDIASLSTADLEARLDELRVQLTSARGYLESNTKALKKVRQMRGADAYKKRWEFEGHIEKNQARVTQVEEEIGRVTAELNARSQ